jgi:glycosyltransferase involved in cell wall biosynthesis
MKIAVVIPVYNENRRIVEVVNEIYKNYSLPIVVVDDGSGRSSVDLLMGLKKRKKIKLLRHRKNLGKGSAMLTGSLYCWEKGYDAIIFMDGDGQHNPTELTLFVKELKKYPLVFGYRDLGKKMPFIRRMGNKAAKYLVKKLFLIDRYDFLCGYFALKKEVFDKIRWTSNRYGVETEIATLVAKNRLKYIEVPVETIYKNKYKGVTLLDAIKILLKIPVWYYRK